MEAMTPKLYKLIAADEMIKFYKSKEWRAVRADALQRDNHECQRCKRKGMFSPADCVHHIKYVKDCPYLALTLCNLESLCNQCHNEEHGRLPNQKKAKSNSNIFKERW
ncbi:HNH endonuclease [Listeria fleischmannii]|uniref:Putative HNH nuclease YajD n=1 Tax=Listeria fleischmannii FSL S10-1203 TaxID=1265822 RepID=W7DT19_9LIST|nr:HNH endonuclease signature motif containing protein [Listeria fleischmannii]EUJ56429.1 Gp54 protein [Listeria fleischmannii FSL S10-1203]